MTKKVITLADELAIVTRFHDQYMALLPLSINKNNANIWPFLHPAFAVALATYKRSLEDRLLLSGEECQVINKVIDSETFKNFVDNRRYELGKLISLPVDIFDENISVTRNIENENLSDSERKMLELQYNSMTEVVFYLNQWKDFDAVFLNIF